MFFVRMIRLVPLVAVLLLVGFIIYIVAQIKYSPNKAKAIVIKVFTWICIVLTVFFVLCCIYAAIDGNIAALELFLSFATVPAVGLVITMICKAFFIKHHPNYKLEAKKTDHNVGFVEFWKKRIAKFLKDYISNKYKK